MRILTFPIVLDRTCKLCLAALAEKDYYSRQNAVLIGDVVENANLHIDADLRLVVEIGRECDSDFKLVQ